MKITSSHIISKISMPSSPYLSGSPFFSRSGPIFIEIKQESFDQKNYLYVSPMNFRQSSKSTCKNLQ